MSFNLDSLFIEWREKVPTGVPNVKNDYHLVLLKEICLNKGIEPHIVDNVILVLEQSKKIDPETIVKYKGEDGEEKESQYSYASKQPEGTPAKVAADKLKDDGEDDKPSGSKLGPDDFKTDPDDGGSYLKKTDNKDGNFADKKYDSHRNKFVGGMNRLLPRIPFDSDEEKDVFVGIMKKIENNDMGFSNEEKEIAGKYIGKSDSDRTAKLYVATTKPRDFADKSQRGQIDYKSRAKNVNGPEYMDNIAKALDLPTAAAQATKAKSGERVTSKVRGKDLTPTEINKSIDVPVSRITDSKGNVTGVKFGSSSHNVSPMPDKQKLVDTFIKRGMNAQEAELKARKVRNSIRKHNEFLLDLSKDRESFQVASMIEGADPSTPEGRQQILTEYPRKLSDIFRSIVEKSPGGITPEEEDVMNKLRDLNPNLSPEEYEKEALDVMHELLENPSLVSGSSDLAESLIAMIQMKKGIEVYFPSDVTYKVGDMISLGSIEDINPNDPDYYNKVADAASSIIVTVEEEGPNSVKLGQGAASAAEEKVRMTEYGDKGTRKILNEAISTHEDLFKSKPLDLDLVDKKVETVKQHAGKLGLTLTETDEITEKAKKQSSKWVQLWESKTPKGTENWTDEDWKNCEEALVRYGEMQSLIAYVNNTDMVYQKFTNFRMNNKSKGTELQRTDGVNCLGTVKPAPNMGFTYPRPGVAIPNNVYPSRIGNSCYDKKKKK